jgi:hypothetical protein
MTGLTILNPFFLSLLPLAALPVLFHLFFRLKKQARPFSTLMFFHRIDPKLNARRRLREWFILLLRTLLILFVLLFLSRPVWFGIGKEGEVATVLVIDNSGSMSGTGEGGQSKLKEATDAARGVILQLRDHDKAAIVPVVDDPLAPLPAGLTADKAALKQVLDHLSDTEASGSIVGAVERAIALFEGSTAAHFEIHILSDLQEEKWNQPPVDLRPPRRGTSIVVHRLASPHANQVNVSVAGVDVQSKVIRAGRRVPVQARLLNTTAIEGHVRLNWLDDTGRHGSEEFVLPPRGEKLASVLLDSQDPGFRWVTLWIEGDDFTADNRAALGFFCSEKKPVLFAGATTDFGLLPLAISPGSEGRLSGLIPSFVEPAALAEELRHQPSAFVALTWGTLAQSGTGCAQAIKQFLTDGGSVLLVPSTASGDMPPLPDWLTMQPQVPQAAPGGLGITVLDKAHPLFTDLREENGEVALRNVKAFKFRPLRGPATNTPVLGLEDGRLIMAEQRIGRGRLLASGLAFESSWTTLPLKPGFVAMAQNLALADTASTTNNVALVAGEPLRIAPSEAPSMEVKSLTGSPLDWKGAPARLPTLPRSGVYSVRWGGGVSYLAVRSADREGRQKFVSSDTLPTLGKLPYTVKDFAGSAALISEVRKLEKSLELSPLLLLLALASLLTEGWLANPLPIQPQQSHDQRRG